MAKTAVAKAKNNASFLTGVNAEYIAHLYSKYMVNPDNVDRSWRDFFGELDDNEVALLRELHGASWTPNENRKDTNGFDSFSKTTHAPNIEPAANMNPPQPVSQDVRQSTLDSVQALMLIRAYRARGHMVANLDPLELKQAIVKELGRTYSPK